MSRKLPKWLNPSKGPTQAYAVTDGAGFPMVRQSMLMDDGRIAYLELTPNEIDNLVTDLLSARADLWHMSRVDVEYPEARF